MNGLSVMNRTASTSKNILAVRSEMTWASGKLAVMEASFSEDVLAFAGVLLTRSIVHHAMSRPAEAGHPVTPALSR